MVPTLVENSYCKMIILIKHFKHICPMLHYTYYILSEHCRVIATKFTNQVRYQYDNKMPSYSAW